MDINDYIKEHRTIVSYGGYSWKELAPIVVCKDGFSMSVQASRMHYCSPREDACEFYFDMEVGYPSEEEDLLLPFAEEPSRPCDTVYGHVPEYIINEVINKHGGFAE